LRKGKILERREACKRRKEKKGERKERNFSTSSSRRLYFVQKGTTEKKNF